MSVAEVPVLSQWQQITDQLSSAHNMIMSLILKSCTNYIDTLSVNKNKISCLLSLKQYGRNLIGLLVLHSFVFLQLCSIEETLCRRGTGGWKDRELSCGERLGDTDG